MPSTTHQTTFPPFVTALWQAPMRVFVRGRTHRFSGSLSSAEIDESVMYPNSKDRVNASRTTQDLKNTAIAGPGGRAKPIVKFLSRR